VNRELPVIRIQENDEEGQANGFDSAEAMIIIVVNREQYHEHVHGHDVGWIMAYSVPLVNQVNAEESESVNVPAINLSFQRVNEAPEEGLKING
jgi:hypothetical protein